MCSDWVEKCPVWRKNCILLFMRWFAFRVIYAVKALRLLPLRNRNLPWNFCHDFLVLWFLLPPSDASHCPTVHAVLRWLSEHVVPLGIPVSDPEPARDSLLHYLKRSVWRWGIGSRALQQNPNGEASKDKFISAKLRPENSDLLVFLCFEVRRVWIDDEFKAPHVVEFGDPQPAGSFIVRLP